MRDAAGAARVGPGGSSFVAGDDGAASSESFAQARVVVPAGGDHLVRLEGDPRRGEVLLKLPDARRAEQLPRRS
ncbi:hypothetical protein BIV25_15300 [Streptomyces sp. MUSC 14]|nr:hypothetical protein BIV25_15300 [Streptomyces sp. MUSC 14]